MARLLIGCSAVVSALSLAAAPAPKNAERQVLYFPTKVGAKWVWDTPDGEFTRELTGVEDRGRVKLVTISERVPVDPKPGEWYCRNPGEKLEVSDRGIFLVEFDGKQVNPPICRFTRLGARWAERIGPLTVASATRPPESVVVPAGRFVTIPVDVEYTNPEGERETGVFWWAPEVGVVKTVNTHGKLTVLKSFTSGKD